MLLRGFCGSPGLTLTLLFACEGGKGGSNDDTFTRPAVIGYVPSGPDVVISIPSLQSQWPWKAMPLICPPSGETPNMIWLPL